MIDIAALLIRQRPTCGIFPLKYAPSLEHEIAVDRRGENFETWFYFIELYRLSL